MTTTPAQLAANAIAAKVNQLNSLKTQLVALKTDGQNMGPNSFSAADYEAALSSEQKTVFEAVIAAIPE